MSTSASSSDLPVLKNDSDSTPPSASLESIIQTHQRIQSIVASWRMESEESLNAEEKKFYDYCLTEQRKQYFSRKTTPLNKRTFLYRQRAKSLDPKAPHLPYTVDSYFEGMPWTSEELQLIERFHHQKMDWIISCLPPTKATTVQNLHETIQTSTSKQTSQFRYRHQGSHPHRLQLDPNVSDTSYYSSDEGHGFSFDITGSPSSAAYLQSSWRHPSFSFSSASHQKKSLPLLNDWKTYVAFEAGQDWNALVSDYLDQLPSHFTFTPSFSIANSSSASPLPENQIHDSSTQDNPTPSQENPQNPLQESFLSFKASLASSYEKDIPYQLTFEWRDGAMEHDPPKLYIRVDPIISFTQISSSHLLVLDGQDVQCYTRPSSETPEQAHFNVNPWVLLQHPPPFINFLKSSWRTTSHQLGSGLFQKALELQLDQQATDMTTSLNLHEKMNEGVSLALLNQSLLHKKNLWIQSLDSSRESSTEPQVLPPAPPFNEWMQLLSETIDETRRHPQFNSSSILQWLRLDVLHHPSWPTVWNRTFEQSMQVLAHSLWKNTPLTDEEQKVWDAWYLPWSQNKKRSIQEWAFGVAQKKMEILFLRRQATTSMHAGDMTTASSDSLNALSLATAHLDSHDGDPDGKRDSTMTPVDSLTLKTKTSLATRFQSNVKQHEQMQAKAMRWGFVLGLEQHPHMQSLSLMDKVDHRIRQLMPDAQLAASSPWWQWDREFLSHFTLSYDQNATLPTSSSHEIQNIFRDKDSFSIKAKSADIFSQHAWVGSTPSKVNASATQQLTQWLSRRSHWEVLSHGSADSKDSTDAQQASSVTPDRAALMVELMDTLLAIKPSARKTLAHGPLDFLYQTWSRPLSYWCNADSFSNGHDVQQWLDDQAPQDILLSQWQSQWLSRMPELSTLKTFIKHFPDVRNQQFSQWISTQSQETQAQVAGHESSLVDLSADQLHLVESWHRWWTEGMMIERARCRHDVQWTQAAQQYAQDHHDLQACQSLSSNDSHTLYGLSSARWFEFEKQFWVDRLKSQWPDYSHVKTVFEQQLSTFDSFIHQQLSQEPSSKSKTTKASLASLKPVRDFDAWLQSHIQPHHFKEGWNSWFLNIQKKSRLLKESSIPTLWHSIENSSLALAHWGGTLTQQPSLMNSLFHLKVSSDSIETVQLKHAYSYGLLLSSSQKLSQIFNDLSLFNLSQASPQNNSISIHPGLQVLEWIRESKASFSKLSPFQSPSKIKIS